MGDQVLRRFAVPAGQAAPTEELQIRDTGGICVPTEPCMLSGMPGTLWNRAGGFDLDGREAWLFISIKNRRFTRSYVNWFIDMCEEYALEGWICPVDEPYRHNMMGELGCDELPDAEFAKIERVSSEITRMAQKAINGKRTTRVRQVTWAELASDTPTSLKTEFRNAFLHHPVVRDLLHDHVTSVKTMQTPQCFERFAEFFLAEVPVLWHAYYRNGAALDVYPGLQPEFLWKIDAGRFEAELPRLTALGRTGRPLLYLETHDQAFDGDA